ncbi:VOC family protein [Streptomyces sp. V4-01]|uniref:Putative pterin-4-alpha-carbinolamine dehydratase n=1 Tax=Actinacidiphila polyblastidii TaxID=3110430 RepID=A0ABU7PH96_9ACTN|nr:VOC family protein [Streptomyces sp. V4-01]
MDTLGTQEILAAFAHGLADWRKLAQSLAARYRVADPVQGAAFVSAVARAAVLAGREPEIRLGRGFVDVSLFTADLTADGGAGRWVTGGDLDFARTVSALAGEQRLTAAPQEVAQLELALDTADDAAVAPFWSALLTGGPGNTVLDSVIDPTGRVATVWFQKTDPHQPPRQRWHLDLWLAPEVAADRIAAAVAAGGTVVSDAEAPAFTVLADPDGNKVCVCTALDRE